MRSLRIPILDYLKELTVNPSILAKFLRWKIGNKEKIIEFISSLTNSPVNTIDRIFSEIAKSPFELMLRRSLSKHAYLGKHTYERGRLFYVITRLIKPKLIIETGVLGGYSSAFFLYALEKNGEGKLISIDLPDYKALAGNPPGFLVPSFLRPRWKLILGRSSDVLSKMRLDGIDLFFHDSEHSFENMMYEFEYAWGILRKGGILLSDNVDANIAFKRFYAIHNVKPYFMPSINSIYGGVRKD